MKKLFYPLMLLGISLTGCQSDEPTQKYPFEENYTKAFIQEFGIIDIEHDWGFKTRKSSRADDWDIAEARLDGSKMNVQYNLWKNPPMVKDWEEQKVIEYLRNTPYDQMKRVDDLNLTTSYFITHVFGNEIERTRLDGQTENQIKMDQLVVGYESADLSKIGVEGWDHAKDFNYAENKDNLGNTVCVGGGSMNFAYHNSFDECWYDNYIVIPGSEIDYRLVNYYYLCFDYEAYKSNEAKNPKTKYKVKVNWANPIYDNGEVIRTETGSREFDVWVDGLYEKDASSPGITISKDKAPESVVLAALQADDVFKGCNYTNYTIDSYTIVAYEGAHKIIPADGIYDDWVIRLCGNAVPVAFNDIIPIYPHEDPDCDRVFVEDLSIAAGYNLGYSASDWDFNDLVFDVKFVDGKAKIVLRALGGTMPIFIGDGHGNYTEELHSYFGVGSGVMVNTGEGPQKPIVDISDDVKNFQFDSTNANDIKVFIETKAPNNELFMTELKAQPGQAPSKLCVPSYLAAPTERMKITSPYPNFENYVGDKSQKFWEHKDNINNDPSLKNK